MESENQNHQNYEEDEDDLQQPQENNHVQDEQGDERVDQLEHELSPALTYHEYSPGIILFDPVNLSSYQSNATALLSTLSTLATTHTYLILRGSHTSEDSLTTLFLKSSEHEKKIEELTLENIRLSNALTQSSELYQQLEIQIEQLKKISEHQNEKITSFNDLEEYSKSLREECERHEASINTWATKYAELEASLSAANTQIVDLLKEKKVIGKSLEEKESRVAELEQDLCQLETALSELNSSSSKQEQEQEEVEGRYSQQISRSNTIMTESSCSEDSSEQSQIDESQPSSPPPPALTQQPAEDYSASIPQISISNDPNLSLCDLLLTAKVTKQPISPSKPITPSSASVESHHIHEKTKKSASQSQLEESNKRLISRLNFLNSRLEAKEETIKRLNRRIEEVVIERDNFREAMQNNFMREIKNPEETPAATPPLALLNASTLTASVIVENKKAAAATSSMSLLGQTGDWTGSVDSLKGVVGSFLSGSITTLPGATSPSTHPASKDNQPSVAIIQSLQSQIHELQKEVKALQGLKSLTDECERLKEQVEKAEEATRTVEKWADTEFSLLNGQIESLTRERSELLSQLETSKAEIEKSQKAYDHVVKKYSKYEEKMASRQSRIETLEKEVKEYREKAIDPLVVENLENKAAELSGEVKHWQNKAQSLSKEIQRSVNLQTELARLQEEIRVQTTRIEELQAERAAFREAMQQAMVDSSISSPRVEPQQQQQKQSFTTPLKSSISSAAGGWLKNIV